MKDTTESELVSARMFCLLQGQQGDLLLQSANLFVGVATCSPNAFVQM